MGASKYTPVHHEKHSVESLGACRGVGCLIHCVFGRLDENVANYYTETFYHNDHLQNIQAREIFRARLHKTLNFTQQTMTKLPENANSSTTVCRLPSAVANARCLAVFGDSVTTDHISPAGSIKPDSSAGKFLTASGVSPNDFNSYGARRGNDRVMTRGTFANIRIRNRLVPGKEGGFTKFLPTGEVLPIYDVAVKYQEQDIPLIILAGSEYGTGSSRDWAAKGTALLGVKAVIARSFERIHRGNLVGMGVLPLEFMHGASVESLNLTGEEEFTLPAICTDFTPGSTISVIASKPVMIKGREMLSEVEFHVRVRIDTPVELQYYLNGGILPTVMKTLSGAQPLQGNQ